MRDVRGNVIYPTSLSHSMTVVKNSVTYNQHMILAGDFNVVLNQELDTMNYKKLNNPKNQCELTKIIDILDLEDIFRISHPELRRYT